MRICQLPNYNYHKGITNFKCFSSIITNKQKNKSISSPLNHHSKFMLSTNYINNNFMNNNKLSKSFIKSNLNF